MYQRSGQALRLPVVVRCDAMHMGCTSHRAIDSSARLSQRIARVPCASRDVLSDPDGSITMQTNVCGIDRAFRIIIGIALIALAATGVIGWWGWLGIIPLATGLIRSCPLYSMLGLNWCQPRSTG